MELEVFQQDWSARKPTRFIPVTMLNKSTHPSAETSHRSLLQRISPCLRMMSEVSARRGAGYTRGGF